MTPAWAVIQFRTELKRIKKHGGSKLELLKKWAGVVAKPRKNKFQAPLRERRKSCNRMTRFEKNVDVCWSCSKTRFLIRHHVIQLQNGGSNWHLNIVRICEDCHAEIHPWLVKTNDPLVKLICTVDAT
jgi:hypothetical protein